MSQSDQSASGLSAEERRAAAAQLEHWRHQIDVGAGVVTRGWEDLRPEAARLEFPKDLSVDASSTSGVPMVGSASRPRMRGPGRSSRSTTSARISMIGQTDSRLQPGFATRTPVSKCAT